MDDGYDSILGQTGLQAAFVPQNASGFAFPSPQTGAGLLATTNAPAPSVAQPPPVAPAITAGATATPVGVAQPGPVAPGITSGASVAPAVPQNALGSVAGRF